MGSLVERLIKPRLRVQDVRAEHLEQIVSSLPTPTMQHERAVLDLLVDRLTLLDACDELYRVIEDLRVERDNAYENASQQHQAAMAKLRGELAVAKDALREAGRRGGVSRAEKLSPERRKEIAVAAANARWKK